MSWSISVIGKGEAVKREFNKYVDGCTSMPESEKETLNLLKEIVAHEVNSAPGKSFSVEGNGSIYERQDYQTRHAQFTIKTVEVVE
jgi:hypothetical protein